MFTPAVKGSAAIWEPVAVVGGFDPMSKTELGMILMLLPRAERASLMNVFEITAVVFSPIKKIVPLPIKKLVMAAISVGVYATVGWILKRRSAPVSEAVVIGPPKIVELTPLRLL